MPHTSSLLAFALVSFGIVLTPDRDQRQRERSDRAQRGRDRAVVDAAELAVDPALSDGRRAHRPCRANGAGDEKGVTRAIGRFH